MEYKSYQHIEKLGREECEGVLNGTVTIQPKIDGTCSVVWLGEDGTVHAVSRKRKLSLTAITKVFITCLANTLFLTQSELRDLLLSRGCQLPRLKL